MKLTHYRPLSLLHEAQRELENMFGRKFSFFEDEKSKKVSSEWMPSVDIKEEVGQFVLYADIPGVAPEDIEITMDGSVLTIKGERKAEKEVKEDNYTRLERSSGQFYRRFTLPDTINPEHISAKGNHGVLEISIPKKEEGQAKARKIQVKS